MKTVAVKSLALLVFVATQSILLGSDQAVVSKLIADLKSKEISVCVPAAIEIGKLGPSAKAAVPQLIEKLSDHRWVTSFPPKLGHWGFSVAGFAADALVKIGADAVPDLLAMLADTKPEQRERAAFVLEEIGIPAKKSLPTLLQLARHDENEGVRLAAVKAYAAIQVDRPEVVRVLTDALEDKSPDVRGLVAERLGNFGPDAKASVPSLIRILQDEGERRISLSMCMSTQRPVRDDAATALGRIGPSARSAIRPLSEMMNKDDDLEMQASAALAICRIDENNSRAFRKLVQLLKEDNDGLGPVLAALSALGELGLKARPAFEAVAALTQHDDDWIRRDAVNALLEIHCKDAMPYLIKELDDPERINRQFAAETLEELGPDAVPAVPKLIDKLAEQSDDDSFWVRAAAAKALGKIGSAAEKALPALNALARDDELEVVREAAAEAVKRISAKD